MKTLKTFIFGTVVLFLASCATSANFPISTVIPAADITAKIKQDKNKNYVVEVTANHLASAERLSPPKNTYIVWVVTENNGTKNIGQLHGKNGGKSSLKTITPFYVTEIFITAEDQADISYPYGVEISRTRYPGN